MKRLVYKSHIHTISFHAPKAVEINSKLITSIQPTKVLNAVSWWKKVEQGIHRLQGQRFMDWLLLAICPTTPTVQGCVTKGSWHKTYVK